MIQDSALSNSEKSDFDLLQKLRLTGLDRKGEMSTLKELPRFSDREVRMREVKRLQRRSIRNDRISTARQKCLDCRLYRSHTHDLNIVNGSITLTGTPLQHSSSLPREILRARYLSHERVRGHNASEDRCDVGNRTEPKAEP